MLCACTCCAGGTTLEQVDSRRVLRCCALHARDREGDTSFAGMRKKTSPADIHNLLLLGCLSMPRAATRLSCRLLWCAREWQAVVNHPHHAAGKRAFALCEDGSIGSVVPLVHSDEVLLNFTIYISCHSRVRVVQSQHTQAVVGREYGYACAAPSGLPPWR